MSSPRLGWLLTVWALSVIGVLALSLILSPPVRDDGRLVSRTVSYLLVAGISAGMFAAIAIGVPRLLGLPGDSPLLVAGATLAAAALFYPLQRRVQDTVDRRFNRARYDGPARGRPLRRSSPDRVGARRPRWRAHPSGRQDHATGFDDRMDTRGRRDQAEVGRHILLVSTNR